MLHFVVHIQFEKPGRREDFDYPDMAKEAGMSVTLCVVVYVLCVHAYVCVRTCLSMHACIQ